jgi:hypothetical protein
MRPAKCRTEDGLAIAQVTREDLIDQHIRRLHIDADNARNEPYHRVLSKMARTNEEQQQPKAGDLYIFRGRRGDLVKILSNDQAAGAFPSMSLFLVTVVAFAAGLLGTLYLLFRDAQQGTKAPKRSLLSNWK